MPGSRSVLCLEMRIDGASTCFIYAKLWVLLAIQFLFYIMKGHLANYLRFWALSVHVIVEKLQNRRQLAIWRVFIKPVVYEAHMKVYETGMSENRIVACVEM